MHLGRKLHWTQEGKGFQFDSTGRFSIWSNHYISDTKSWSIAEQIESNSL